MISFVKCLVASERNVSFKITYLGNQLEQLNQSVNVYETLTRACGIDTEILALMTDPTTTLPIKESMFITNTDERAIKGCVVCVCDITLIEFTNGGKIQHTGIFEGQIKIPDGENASTASFIDACVSSAQTGSFDYSGYGQIIFPDGTFVAWEKTEYGLYRVVSWISEKIFLVGLYSRSGVIEKRGFVKDAFHGEAVSAVPQEITLPPNQERALLFRIGEDKPLATVETFLASAGGDRALSTVAPPTISGKWPSQYMLAAERWGGKVEDFSLTTINGFELPLN